MYRIGQGFDVHQFSEQAPLQGVMLGGICVPSKHDLVAHSDGDVVLHALCDALLGGAGLGDIGTYFSDTDQKFKDMASAYFVQEVMLKLQQQALKPVNVDITIIAQQPKISPYRAAMNVKIAELLGLESGRVNVKATTTEWLGFLGRGEGIAAQATVLLQVCE